jgi:acyl carrier protein
VLGLDRPIGTRETFASLGVDSLQTATLYLAIEEAFGVMLTLDLARDAETIELLALHLDAAAGPRSPPPGAAARDAIEALVQSQRGYLAAWKGRRVGPRGLLSRFDEPGADDAPPLFWCFQGSAEHQELARQLGEAQPVVAMRSGYLIMDYTDENLAALAACYADEVMAVQPAGPLRLGGNCQGGLVMHRVALELISRGRDVALLILMEVGQFPAYPGRVALLFGSDSHFNPYLSLADPARVFDLAYPGGYEVRMVPGKHGRFFRPPFSAPLAGRIASLLGADHPPPADAV